MELTAERKKNIRRRLEPLLAEFDPKLKFIQVIIDSSRENLAVVVQRDDRPAILRLDFVRYISMPDAELRATLREQLQRKRLVPTP
ncbi:MAG: hypothetical protein V3R29_08215 [Candidatus Acidoferrales bacterium]